MNGLPWRLW